MEIVAIAGLLLNLCTVWSEWSSSYCRKHPTFPLDMGVDGPRASLCVQLKRRIFLPVLGREIVM